MGRRHRLRTVGGAVGAVLLVLIGLAALGTAMRDDSPTPDSLFLHGAEVPAGLTPYPGESGVLPTPAGTTSYLRSWVADGGHAALFIQTLDAGRPAYALSTMRVIERLRSANGTPLQPLSVIDGAVGGAFDSPQAGVRASEIVFPRGEIVIRLVTEVDGTDPTWDYQAVVLEAATAEQARLARVYTGAAPTKIDFWTSLGSAFGGGIAYVVYLGLIAFWRDPLRRDRRVPPLPPTAPEAVVDVTERAGTVRLRAQIFVAVELAAAMTIVAAAFPASLTTRVALIGAGFAVYFAVALLRRVTVHAPGGRRSLRAIALRSVGALLLLLATLSLFRGAIAQGETPGGDVNFVATACFLAAAGICQRRAHRVAAKSAPQALAKDTRPPVLFLRSWGDDALRLRTATLGRLSLLERLSPGRFDSFEEVLARRLSAFGPVVAVNPPGTRMPPIGAARQTMAEDSWQTIVRDWMSRAALVVVSAPPGTPSPGLVWELGELTVTDGWARILIVVPPTGATELRRRWDAFAWAGPDYWPFRATPPADVAQTLVLTRASGSWLAFTARRRNEWAYAAALEAAREALASTTPDGNGSNLPGQSRPKDDSAPRDPNAPAAT